MALYSARSVPLITFQLQAAATAPNGDSVASDMWSGIVAALILAFLTASSYAELAKIYPEAGFGSCYYFAEKAFLDREEKTHHKWARLAKLVTGWAAHLFYWVYPGVMVAFMATLVAYISALPASRCLTRCCAASLPSLPFPSDMPPSRRNRLDGSGCRQ
jgi:amino acid transporter